MCASAKASTGWTLATFSRVLEPHKEVMAERSKANEERHLNQFIMEAYEQFDFSLSMLASRLKVVEHAGPMPPAVEKTKACSLNLT